MTSWNVRWFVLIAFICVFAACGGGGDDPVPAADAEPSFWEEDDTAQGEEEYVDVDGGTTFSLDLEGFTALLATAPLHPLFGGEADAEPLRIDIPVGSEQFVAFDVFNAPILGGEVLAANPHIMTFQGERADGEIGMVHCEVTDTGFHASVWTPQGTILIDPAWVNDTEHYVVYGREDRGTDEHHRFQCDCEHGSGGGLHTHRTHGTATKLTNGANFRTFRLAAIATDAFVAFAAPDTAVSAITTIVNRLNQTYGREFSVNLRFDWIITFAPSFTDPFPTTGDVLGEAQSVTNSVLADGDYDIGHTFDAAGGLNGVASLGVLCVNGSKARGWTSVDNTTCATCRAYVVDYVAHEVGHQFGGQHPWNGDDCFAPDTSIDIRVEPGSGTTIMAYSGICGNDNVITAPPGFPDTPAGDPAFSDDYFHAANIDEIVAHMNSQAGCGITAASGNSLPTANAGGDFTIPANTPFTLTGSGTDADAGDQLTYCWEGMNPSPVGDPVRDLFYLDDGRIALFRSRAPVMATSRTFPDMNEFLLPGSTYPGSGGVPGGRGEQLPAMARTLTFRLTVRDNRAVGGTACDDMQVTVAASTGFTVTSPNGGECWGEGTVQTITWDVAGSDAAPVNAANVAIDISDDGFQTFTTLAASTPNDGSHDVTLPTCQLSTTVRIRVRAVGNIFFDISDADFEVKDITPPNVTLTVGRGLIWSPRQGLIDVPFSATVTDNCDPAVTDFAVAVYSNVDHGAAPYTPDATFNAASPDRVRVRAERILPGGRVYLVVFRATDASGNAGYACRPVVVPEALTAQAVQSVLNDGNAAAMACEAPPGGVLPVGWFPLLPFTALP